MVIILFFSLFFLRQNLLLDGQLSYHLGHVSNVDAVLQNLCSRSRKGLRV